MNERGQIDFGAVGQEPKQTVFSFTELSDKKPSSISVPDNLSDKTKEFWKDIIRYETYMALDEPSRQLVFRYFFTITPSTVLSESLRTDYRNVAAKIRRRMVAMWNNLPADIHTKYKKSEVRRLKNIHRANWISEVREKRVSLIKRVHQEYLQRERESARVDYSEARRSHDPRNGAIMNLAYALGPNFPSKIRTFYLNNPQAFMEWSYQKPPYNRIVYRLDRFYYVEGLAENLKSEELTPDLINKLWLDLPAMVRVSTLSAFGKLTKEELRSTLIEAQLPKTPIPNVIKKRRP